MNANCQSFAEVDCTVPTEEILLVQNQDGLIYADLDLRATSSERPVLGAQDRVNYETIDFTRTAPLPPSPEDIELREEDEELK